jgi:precorrin-2/cobalt-factor-2 C20-methyltransferase
VRKTSVYLPEALKERLAKVAQRTGRSEAQLIRQAVERLVDSEPVAHAPVARRDDPVTARYQPGPALVGVGVGPGDPGLLTLRAVEILRSVDRVLAPTTSRMAVGRAEAIVRDAVPDVTVERVPFVMEVGSDARAAALDAAAAQVIAHLDSGERVAFITLGDPNVYSTFSSLADAVRAQCPGIPVDAVPGIMAFQDLASRSGTTLVDGEEHLILVPGHHPAAAEVLARAVGEKSAAVVVYKGGARLGDLASSLDDAGRLDGAVMGELLGLPGGRAAPLAEVAERPASYLTTVVVPPVRAPVDAASAAPAASSSAAAT